MTTFLIIFAMYIAVFFLNRWIMFQYMKTENETDGDFLLVIFCFMGPVGTILLTLIYIVTQVRINDWFKPKKFRK